MKSILLSFLIGCLSIHCQAQTIDNDQFKTDIISLYEAGMKSFKTNKEGEAIDDNGSVKFYKSNLELSGAKNSLVQEDSEGNYKYVASYTLKNVRDPKSKVDEIAILIAEATSEFGFEKATTTDVKYLGYSKHTIEFPADNIDDMGKHTSFSVGLTDDGNPMYFEIIVTEILWK